MAYQHFSPANTAELIVRRHGLFRPYYELSDGRSTYGKLKFGGFLLKEATVETAAGSWTFTGKVFSRTISITDQKGLPVARLNKKWFSQSVLLTMNDDTRNQFSHPSFWKRSYTFTNSLGKVMEFKSRVADKNPVKITLGKNFRSSDQTLLMAFTGAYLILNIRRKKAAAAH